MADSCIVCRASDRFGSICFDYFPLSMEFRFSDVNYISEVIRKNKFQFTKVICSALKGKIKLNQGISCVFIEGFNFLGEKDYGQFIQLDRRNDDLIISSSVEGTDGLYKVFTDGSFAADTMNSGYGGIIQNIEGDRKIFSKSFPGGSSNLMELLAVLDGLKQLQTVEAIQVNTDSRFVIRGMVQWIHFWKHNDWQTAYGTKVKFADYWQQMDKLSEGKFIEFKWIKGHSGHAEQDFCHQLARKSARLP